MILTHNNIEMMEGKQNLTSFLDSMEKRIEEAREGIIKDSQRVFEYYVKSLLKEGDTLFVANGTSLLKRGKVDSTEDDNLREITEEVNRGAWEIGFDFPYKTEV